MSTSTNGKRYVLNLETSKIELHFTKEEYKSLPQDQKRELKRYFLFSGKRKAWVSRSKNNHYMAIQTAEKLGFINGGEIGERLSFSEEMEREQKKAEARAERYNRYSKNAEKRAENLQSEFKEYSKDWSWLTQPIITGHAGSERFGRQKEKVMKRYEKGFEEYRKSEYFKQRAKAARQTADQAKLKNRTYLNNRIEECNKKIRSLEKAVITAEEKQDQEWLKRLLDNMEYEIDKLAFFENCLDELGGVQYNKDNVKAGYFVFVRGEWQEVKKANPKTVELQSKHVPYTLKYSYAEIQDLKIPEGWTEKKDTFNNPFKVGDIVYRTSIGGNKVIAAYQIVKVTAKSVQIQKVKIENNKPVKDAFTEDKPKRRTVKEVRGSIVVNDTDWYLYKYEEKE